MVERLWSWGWRDVDIYGLDSYPSCWSCNVAECTKTNGNVPGFTVVDYYDNFQQVSPTQPSFLAEFQGGSYNPLGDPQGRCINTTGPGWVNVFYRLNVAEKVTVMNVYMAFGGTSWGKSFLKLCYGRFAAWLMSLLYTRRNSSVGTSYDYSAPISKPPAVDYTPALTLIR
jgi:hypothetical protein